MPPNIPYIHTHDTGRYVQPYGHTIPTPNLQRLAELRSRLDRWMRATDDPLLRGPIPALPGARDRVLSPEAASPRELPRGTPPR